MQKQAIHRIEKIGRTVANERARIAALGSKLIDDLKPMLGDCSHRLDDVERLFLDANILCEPRTDVALARWLDEAEDCVRSAEHYRKSIENLGAKYGRRARAISP